MLLYAITDRRALGDEEPARCAAVLRQAERWFAAGIHFIQLREPDLHRAALEPLAAELVSRARRFPQSRVLVNGPAALAYRAGAAGVHLPGSAHAALAEHIAQVRSEWADKEEPFVSVACHTADEAVAARHAGASLIVFAPVFEKPLRHPAYRSSERPEASIAGLPGKGLAALAEACQAAAPVPLVALGGVVPGNAARCLAAGAAGVAGIRLFAGEDWLQLLGRNESP